MLIEEVYKNQKTIKRMDSANRRIDTVVKRMTEKIAKKVSALFLLSVVAVILLVIGEGVFLDVLHPSLSAIFTLISFCSLFAYFIKIEKKIIKKENEKIKKTRLNILMKKNSMGKMSDINEDNIDSLFDEIISMREQNKKINVPKKFIHSIIDFKEELMDLDLDNKISNIVEKKEKLKELTTNKSMMINN